METKKSKYDTNPLDPEVGQKAEDVWGDLGGVTPTQEVGGATRQVGESAPENARQNVYSEAPTRRYDNPPLEAPYPSVFVPPTYAPPTQYQQPPQNPYISPAQQGASRPVMGLGVAERWATMMAYAPYVGVVVSIIELFLAPRREVRVRFHAAQALSLHIAIIIVETVLGVIGTLTNSSAGGSLVKTAAFVFLVLSMIRVWRGESHRITPLAEPAQWFNQHIEPRNQG